MKISSGSVQAAICLSGVLMAISGCQKDDKPPNIIYILAKKPGLVFTRYQMILVMAILVATGRINSQLRILTGWPGKVCY